MARRPLPVSYRQAMIAIRDALMIITSITAMPDLPQPAREQLRLLADRLALLVARDNGRSR